MKIADPFPPLLPLLIDEIPRTLGAEAGRKRLCRVILWYYDTSAPCCYFLADAMPDSYRRKDVRRGYLTDYASDQKPRIEAMIGTDPALPSYSLFAKVYQLLCTKGRMDESFARLRTFAQDVCGKLNRTDWSPFCSVTGDFVIYPQNGTDYYCGTEEDIGASIPTAKKKLLRSRGLLR
jgi:hypothetical protein